ncbi:tetratricopeptide repeat protein [Hydrogenimonas cancrithermarum]|uniref:DUF7494 domain-containing protein n=1 Tax=Hydrogenimonas cancrithermarum TaxID=2993563 RepID=A0ABN6WW37_9BACT|nr:hypothetical protein [Hydrogenimonas cancrithermarum]BDY13296.1 hypothetical protein HCR_16080 [Hydrogenimonas cancrithermarum]
MHIRDGAPFRCETVLGEAGEPTSYRCLFRRMPESRLAPIVTDFFDIGFEERKDAFVCLIAPKKQSLIHPLPPPVHENPEISTHPLKISNHWIVIGYEDQPPYLGKKRKFENGLSFPLDFKSYSIPTVGAVDINGDPVFMKNNRDIERFIAVKEAFERGKYKKAYDLASEALESFPNTIFASDFLRYKIKSLAREDMKEHADEIIALGKLFIKRYTSDEYLPEVLLLLARVYSATGFTSDANYFFDRLINEHKGTRFANLGLIYLGDQLYINGKVKEATKRYLEAYYSAKDIDVASLAAYKLAIRYLDRGMTKDAVSYLEKIWKRNPDFLLKEKEDAHSIAQQLAARRAYDLAIEINKGLLKKLKKLDDIYETVMFEIAEWYDEKGDVRSAIDWYEKYLDAFAYGEFSDKAKENLDALFVMSNDANATEALRKYESLMREYRGSPIADKALAAKLKVLLAEKRFDEVLALSDMIDTIETPEAKRAAEETRTAAARALFDEAVKRKECKTGIAMVEKYGIETAEKEDDYLYGCYAKYARYEDALKIAERHLGEKNLKERIVWLCRSVHMLTSLRRYREALKASADVRALSGKGAEKACPNLPWDEVKAYHALSDYAKEIALIRQMARRYGNDMRMAEIYRMGYDSAKKAGDTLQQFWMLKRLIALQNSKGSHPYSPWVEFEAIRLLKAQKKYKEALAIAEGMETLSLSGEKRGRWLYEKGLLYRLTGRQKASKEAFRECAAVKGGGAWRKLCEEALTLQNF